MAFGIGPFKNPIKIAWGVRLFLIVEIQGFVSQRAVPSAPPEPPWNATLNGNDVPGVPLALKLGPNVPPNPDPPVEIVQIPTTAMKTTYDVWSYEPFHEIEHNTQVFDTFWSVVPDTDDPQILNGLYADGFAAVENVHYPTSDAALAAWDDFVVQNPQWGFLGVFAVETPGSTIGATIAHWGLMTFINFRKFVERDQETLEFSITFDAQALGPPGFPSSKGWELRVGLWKGKEFQVDDENVEDFQGNTDLVSEPYTREENGGGDDPPLTQITVNIIVDLRTLTVSGS